MQFASKGGGVRRAEFFHEVDGGAEVVGGDVGELLAVEGEEGVVEFFEESEAFGGDAGGDDAAIAGIASAEDEAPGGEAVEEAGDVGVAGDHVFGDGFAGHTGVAGTSEDAEDVELDGGEAEGFEEFLESAEEEVSGAQDVEGDFLFEAVEGVEAVNFFGELPTHWGRVSAFGGRDASMGRGVDSPGALPWAWDAAPPFGLRADIGGTPMPLPRIYVLRNGESPIGFRQLRRMGMVMARATRFGLVMMGALLAGCSVPKPQPVPPTPLSGAGRNGSGGGAGGSPGARALLAADTASEQDFRKIINGAKAKVFPAVVFIKCVQQDLTGGEKANREVAGSGAIISAGGQILTNWHVIDKAVELRCLLYDGRAYDAKVIGSDKDTDLALLQLVDASGKPANPGSSPFPYARFGDSSKMQEGDFVMAMGAPWGLSRSVSLGIISCTKRYLPDTSEYSAWMQTDASISPGNSGGPLVNTDGEIIGVNTRGIMEGGDLGFAVPSETIQPVIAQIRASGKVDWSWTGLQLQPLKDFNRNMYFDGNEGVIVADTDPDSPARHAGLQPRDRILKINGTAVAALTDEDLPEVRRLLGTLPKDKPATLQIQRGDAPMTVEITPREKGQVEGQELALSRWDCTVKTINQFDNPDLYFQRKEGVFVFGVKDPGNAENAGLQQNDIVLKVDSMPVASLEDVEKAHEKTVKAIDQKPQVVVTILRNGLLRQVVLDLSRDYSKQ